MNKRIAVLGIISGMIIAGIAAGATASTIRMAGPVEVRVKENISGTDYYTMGHYATIANALSAINTAADASASKPYIIFLPPGVYDLGGSQISMIPFVDIVGSGQDSTTITCACGSATAPLDGDAAAAILGADNAGLRDLTVENTGGGDYAVGIYNDAVSPRLTRIGVNAYNSITYSLGVHNENSAEPVMTDVTIDTVGDYESDGIANYSSTPIMTRVNITVSGGTSDFGIYNYLSSAVMTDMTIHADAFGGTTARAVFNYQAAPTMTNVNAKATGGSNENAAVYNTTSAFPHIFGGSMIVTGGGASSSNYGLYLDGGSYIEMTGTTIDIYGGQDAHAIHSSAAVGLWMHNVVANAVGGSSTDTGMYAAAGGIFTMDNVSLYGVGGTNGYGLYLIGTAGTVEINRSHLWGTTTSLDGMSGWTYYIGGTYLDGSLLYSGTFYCAETYGANWLPYNSDCSNTGALLPGGSNPDKSAGAPEPSAPSEPPALAAPGE